MNITTLSRRSLRRSAAISALAAGLSAAALPALSEVVTLRSPDGSTNLTGEFVDFRDNNYIIKTSMGELRLSAEIMLCDGAACPKQQGQEAELVFGGSDTVGLGVMPLLLEGYAAFQDAEAAIAPGSENEVLASYTGDGGFGDSLGSISVVSTTSGDAFKKLMDKSAQIGMASRRIKPEEARSLRDAGAGNMVHPSQEHIVAVDSLVVITHPNNPVQQITVAQLADIYAGRVTNWSQPGGPDLPITVVDRPESSGTRSVFQDVVFGDKVAPLPNAVVAPDNNEAAATVNQEPGAIGFVGYAFQRGAKPLDLVNACGITTSPDAFSARTEEYALQRRLYLYNRADTLEEEGRRFLS